MTGVDREAPLLFQRAMQTMRVEPWVKWLLSKKRNALLGEALQLWVKPTETASVPRVDVNRHTRRNIS
jgi:hypothetical protein